MKMVNSVGRLRATPLILLLMLFFVSCGMKKDLVYFQNSDKVFNDPSLIDSASYETRIVPYDNLLILVSAPNAAAVEIFNKNSQTIGTTGGGGRNLEYQGYLVNKEGNIQFPVLGTLHVAGLKKEDVEQMILEEIAKVVENPTVEVRFLNFRVIFLGDVGVGVFTFPNERVSIVEAIAEAGDLMLTGQRHDVRIFRVENGEKKTFTVDLTKPELFFSPHYYLQQNDIIYVTPNTTKARSASNLMPLLSIGMTLFSTAVTLYYFFAK